MPKSKKALTETVKTRAMLPPGTRFANTRICTMTPCGKWGVSDDGSNFYEVFQVGA